MNSALSITTYTPSPDTFGDVHLTVFVDDNGNNGSGGPLTHSATFTVTVNPVNDPPIIQVPHGTHTVEEDGTLVVSGVTFMDKDEHIGLHRVSLEVRGTLGGGGKDVGLVKVKNGPGIKWVEGEKDGAKRIEFMGR